MSIVKVSDAKTNKLKRIEDAQGKVLANMRGDRLYMTALAKKKGYRVSGRKLIGKTGLLLA